MTIGEIRVLHRDALGDLDFQGPVDIELRFL